MNAFRLMIRHDSTPVLVNSNTLEYTEYLDSGYEVIASGNKKELQEQFDKLVGSMADND